MQIIAILNLLIGTFLFHIICIVLLSYSINKSIDYIDWQQTHNEWTQNDETCPNRDLFAEPGDSPRTAAAATCLPDDFGDAAPIEGLPAVDGVGAVADFEWIDKEKLFQVSGSDDVRTLRQFDVVSGAKMNEISLNERTIFKQIDGGGWKISGADGNALVMTEVGTYGLHQITKSEFQTRLIDQTNTMQQSGPSDFWQKLHKQEWVTKYDKTMAETQLEAVKVEIDELIEKQQPDFLSKYPSHWLETQMLYAEEQEIRMPLFDWLKNYHIGVDAILIDKFNVISREEDSESGYKFNMFEWLSLFLLSVDIQQNAVLDAAVTMDEVAETIARGIGAGEPQFVERNNQISDQYEMTEDMGRLQHVWSPTDKQYWIWTCLPNPSPKLQTSIPYHSFFPLLFRGIFIPKEGFDIFKLLFPTALQSWSYSPQGPRLPLETHKGIHRYRSREYEILFMVSAIELVTWKKLMPITFAYAWMNWWTAFQEKEVIMPPFTMYQFLSLKDRHVTFGTDKIVRVEKTKYDNLRSMCDHVITEWTRQNDGHLFVNSDDLMKNIIHSIEYTLDSRAPGIRKFDINFAFLDHGEGKTQIDAWSKWTELIVRG